MGGGGALGVGGQFKHLKVHHSLLAKAAKAVLMLLRCVFYFTF